MERKVSDPDASSSSSKPDAAASSSKAPSVNLVVYSRKRKESHPDASSSKAPSVDMVVYSRKRKKGQPNGASSSKPDAALSSKAPSAYKRPLLSVRGGTFITTPDWLPDGWTVIVLAKANGQKYKEYKETATGKKFYSKPQVLNYLGIADSSNSNKRKVKVAPPKEQVSTLSPTPSEVPKKLYDVIQKVAKLSETVKLNSNNRFAKRKLEYYKPWIHAAVVYSKATDQLPRDWKYDPETFFKAHVPKPPTPSKPKPKPKPKTKKKIKITWRSYNYHGSYPMNTDEQKIWNMFRMKDKTKSHIYGMLPRGNKLHRVHDVMVVDLLGKFAVNTFNKSCKEYVNKDEDNQVSGAEFMECKFYKRTSKYIFYMTIEAIEQGIPGVYETRIECVTGNGEMTLQNFKLTEREPKWDRPWVKPRLESEFKYETVQDGSSDPQDFYPLTGMVHRLTDSGGFNYHNPAYSPHVILINCGCKDKRASSFEVNVSWPKSATKTISMDR